MLIVVNYLKSQFLSNKKGIFKQKKNRFLLRMHLQMKLGNFHHGDGINVVKHIWASEIKIIFWKIYILNDI